jgi:8-amino-7-oxononanoate synthase
MEDFVSRIRNGLNVQTDKNLYRTLNVVPEGMIDFTSNDYLGLARSRDLHNLIQERFQSLQDVQNGSGGSRLLSGNTALAEQCEHLLASIFRSESALIFSSGYMANMGVLSALPRRGDTLIYDELAHACIKDGARLSLANRRSFRHNDTSDLEKKLKKSTGLSFVAVESVYSMDGDECPLQDIVHLAQKYGAVIILDEAHSTGAYGKEGAGLAESLGLERSIPVRIMTFGKAMGVHGACAACSDEIRNHLINFSRSFIYTTALPSHSLVAISCAFEYLRKNEYLRHDLMKKIELFGRSYAGQTGSRSAIQPVLISGRDNVKRAAKSLQSIGYDVRPVLPPTVRDGEERLRISIHCFNDDRHIEALASELNKQHV